MYRIGQWRTGIYLTIRIQEGFAQFISYIEYTSLLVSIFVNIMSLKEKDTFTEDYETEQNDYTEPSVCDSCEMDDGWECSFCCSKCYEDYGECPNPDCNPMDI